MKNLTLPAIALALAAIASLAIVMAPPWVWAWKLAVGVTEFGQWFAIGALVVAVLSVVVLRGAWRVTSLLLSLVALVGFLRPTASALRRAASLPADLRSAFGGEISEEPFEIERLFVGRKLPRGSMTTEIYSRPGSAALKLDFYAPVSEGTNRAVPCVIVVHGGGWDAGDRTELPKLDRRLASLGYAVAAIDYRLMPDARWPAPREDLNAAIQWLQANASRLGIDPSNLVLLGRSAGSQIVEAVGLEGTNPAIRGVISFYGPADLEFGYRNTVENDTIHSRALLRRYLGGTPDEQPNAYRDASGISYVNPRSPPILLLHGRLDTLVWYRHDERLEAKLRATGVTYFYLELPWATHGFDFNPTGPGGQLADTAVRAFLKRVTRDPR